MNTDTWGKWTYHAKSRHMAKLCDGRVVELQAVHRATRSCKVRAYGRHYYCFIEDIALISNVTSPEYVTAMHTGETVEFHDLDPWQIIVLNEDKHQPRTSKAAPSKSWLVVTRTPIHTRATP